MQNVTIDRDKYIGGSDIPYILNISTYEAKGYDTSTGELKIKEKNRYGLLLEKAGLVKYANEPNQYSEYGNTMEPKIRDYINAKRENPFIEYKVITGDLRYHADGWDGETVLEVKTTSAEKHQENMPKYLTQLIFGMMMHETETGLLAVYDRPKNFDEDLNPLLLTTYNIKREDYKELEQKILEGLERFRSDLITLKANPEMKEEYFKPHELRVAVERLLYLEKQIKELEAEREDLKTVCYELFEKYNEKTYKDPWGTVSPVKGTEAKTVLKFDAKAFEKEEPELYTKYSKETTQAGRKSSVRITLS